MDDKEKIFRNNASEPESDPNSDILVRYARDFLALRNAIIENCKDCIRDCGRDCLNSEVKPIENIRCPLQKVRMDYNIAINEEKIEHKKWDHIKGDRSK